MFPSRPPYHEFFERRLAGARSKVSIEMWLEVAPDHALAKVLSACNDRMELVPPEIATAYPELFPRSLAGLRWMVMSGELECVSAARIRSDRDVFSVPVRANFRLEAVAPIAAPPEKPAAARSARASRAAMRKKRGRR